MSKSLEIESCVVCPHYSHGGAFARVSYKPKCALGVEIPYTVKKRVQGRGTVTVASIDRIPDNCPLPDYRTPKRSCHHCGLEVNGDGRCMECDYRDPEIGR